MKEIGEKLKETRESMGISIEEAAEDLKLKPSQLENIEDGNRDAFDDIFYLKYFIRDYSKYLGLDYEEMVEEFNEFVFDYTSKISLEDIRKASKKSEKNERKQPKKVASPYTAEDGKRSSTPLLWLAIFVIVLALLVFVFLVFLSNDEDENVTNGINSKKDISYALVG